MCCCPSKACCICTLIVLVLVAVGLVFGFGIYTRGFHKLTSNIHLDDRHPGGSFRAYGHFYSLGLARRAIRFGRRSPWSSRLGM